MLGRAEQVRDLLDDEALQASKQKLGYAQLPAPPLPCSD